MRPGATTQPSTWRTRRARAASPGPMAAMRPPLTATSAIESMPLRSSSTRPPASTRSKAASRSLPFIGISTYLTWARAGAHRSEIDHLAGLDRPVGGQHDLEALHPVIHVVGEVEVLGDSAQQIALLEFAQLVVVGLAGDVDALVRPAHIGIVPQDLAGFGVGVDVVRLHPGIVLRHDDGSRALGPEHILDEERLLGDHRPPAGLVPADRAVIE